MSGTTDARTGFAARVIAGRPWLALVAVRRGHPRISGCWPGSATETGDSSWLRDPGQAGDHRHPTGGVPGRLDTDLHLDGHRPRGRLWRVTGWRDGAFPSHAVRGAVRKPTSPGRRCSSGCRASSEARCGSSWSTALALATAILFWRRDRLAGGAAGAVSRMAGLGKHGGVADTRPQRLISPGAGGDALTAKSGGRVRSSGPPPFPAPSSGPTPIPPP